MAPSLPAVPALKEWAVVVQALLEGEQIVDIRKGGLREDGRHFAVRANRLWLYPTAEHQDPDLLKNAYRHWVPATEAAAPLDRAVRIEAWADVVGVAQLTEPAQLAALESKLIWTLDYATSRLSWKQRDPLWVIALRVHRLDEPVTLPWREEYGGCTSWVGLDGLPDDPTTLPSRPVLSDVAFDARLAGITAALPDGLQPPDGR